MSVAPIQHYLDLGASAHIDLLHSNIRDGSKAGVYFLRRDRFEGYTPLGTFPKSVAADVAENYAGRDDGLFVSQHAGTLYRPHKLGNVAFLGSFYVDLDHYNTEYRDLDTLSILMAMKTAHPTLPLPTIAGSSGRGLQLVWTFQRGKPASFLPNWQQIEDSLVDALLPFGADPRARDVARVLRFSQSFNEKVGKRADLKQVGEAVTFEEMQRWANAYRKAKKERQTKRQVKRNGASNVTVLPTKNGYTLAHGRMQDYRALAQLRGGRFTDHRKRVIFLFYCAAAWYFGDQDSLQREVDGFIDDCIAEPNKYKGGHYGQVLERHQEALNKQERKFMGKEVDPRYRHRTSTIIRELGVSSTEMLGLRVIIDETEKYRRKVDKRRSQGVRPKADYMAEVSEKARERASQAIQMRDAGMTRKQIATALNVSMTSVKNYLRTA